MRKQQRLCEICDKAPSALSPRDWCQGCEDEFAEWRSRLAVPCTADCDTPISCRILKRCCRAQPVELALIAVAAACG